VASVESRLATIEARDEIRELTARYCHAVVDGDADAIVVLFCDDGVFRAHTSELRGRAALREFYAAGVGAKTHKPFIQNHVIEFQDDTRASGRCSVEIRVLQDGQAFTQAGHYFDKYRRIEGRWLFAERHFVRYHNVPWREGWTK